MKANHRIFKRITVRFKNIRNSFSKKRLIKFKFAFKNNKLFKILAPSNIKVLKIKVVYHKKKIILIATLILSILLILELKINN
jgi:hypothetical protein